MSRSPMRMIFTWTSMGSGFRAAGLNFELAVIQSALQGAPDTRFRQRIERVHHQETAIGAQERATAQIHEIRAPPAAGIVAAVNRPEHIGVGGDRFKNYRALFAFTVGENHVYAIAAEGIALLAFDARAATTFRGRLVFFALAFLEGFEIIENVVAHFFEIFGDLGAGIFFFQFFDDAVHEYGSGFLLEVTHFAGKLAGKRKSLAIHDREFLAELIVLAFELFGGGAFELAFLHHLGDFFDRDHCAIEYRKNFGQGHGADLHAAESELFASDAAGEIVHQFFFAHGEALDDARFLALEGFAFEDLRNAAAEKVYAGLDFFLEGVSLAARQGEQARAVGILEIIYVGAIGGRLALRMQAFDHADDHAAAAGAGKSADEKIVAGGGEFHAHAQRT